MRARACPLRSALRWFCCASLFVTGLALGPGTPARAQVLELAPPRPADENAAAAVTAPACAKIWLGREAEFEDLLRRARVRKVERIPIGVTHPRLAFVEPGLPFSRFAWKPLKPGRYAGFYESYRSEIAAYELDKLIGLAMVPPAVERPLDGEYGAAVLWVENVRGWKTGEEIQGPDSAAWTRELVRMQMFDDLCGNFDRNQGNLLYDAEYHLILIDHSRAFTETVDMSRLPSFAFVDAKLWARMEALTLDTLRPTLGKWLSKGMLRALLARRDRMNGEVEKLVAARGVSVWLR
jgi:hypothetical protein